MLWRSPLPPGLVPTRQLRVEITAFEIGARAVVTNAAGRSPMCVANDRRACTRRASTPRRLPCR
ncbi:MAG: hypothetical protein U1F49_07960 [Rubrivivax sp.]